MKKIYMVFLIIFFLGLFDIKADYECYYKASREMWGIKIDESDFFTVSTNEKKFKYNSIFGIVTTPIVYDSQLNNKYTEEYLIDNYLNGCCPETFYVCMTEMGIPGGTKQIRYYVILNGALYTDIDWQGSNKIAHFGGGFYGKESDCMIANIDKEKTKVCTEKIEFPCDAYDKLIETFENNSCNTEKSDLCNSTRENLISYCQKVLQNGDYGLNPCVKKCLRLHEEISLSENKKEDKCGISDNLQGWIKNILKIGKFIVPVIVMVFGILDFIKAIAADKDDEIKKAQGRFVKRLIAAALIFIIPFIIEFVLDKMGFAANGCGIIDL